MTHTLEQQLKYHQDELNHQIGIRLELVETLKSVIFHLNGACDCDTIEECDERALKTAKQALAKAGGK